jgi:N6-L-threonylcarbamoyladenine synthase
MVAFDDLPQTILALESSCDETACAIVHKGRKVLAHTLTSQIDIHRITGGVVPEVAAREHMLQVNTVIDTTLKQAGLTLQEVDAYAATLGPGLVGSLLAGATTAKTLSILTQKPFIGVHHLMGHVCSVLLEDNAVSSNASDNQTKPPLLCLLVSGGHTQLVWLEGFHPLRLEVLGTSLDDAVGEAYDKIARLMNLPYPGGPQIDTLAHHPQANPERFVFPVAQTQNPLDFSLSGLKTSVRRTWEKEEPLVTTLEAWHQLQRDVAASFQACMIRTLMQRLTKACMWVKTHKAISEGLRVAMVGGVAANRGLRAALVPWAEAHGIQLLCPALHYCSDNAAMIGAAAYYAPLVTPTITTATAYPALAMDVFPRMPLSALCGDMTTSH